MSSRRAFAASLAVAYPRRVMLFNPGYDLNDPGERANQVNDFLREIAMDAGLLGMEARLDEIRRRSVS